MNLCGDVCGELSRPIHFNDAERVPKRALSERVLKEFRIDLPCVINVRTSADEDSVRIWRNELS